LLDSERHAVDEAEERRDLLLVLERQPVLAPPRAKVQQVAHAPEHLARDVEVAHLAGQERAVAHELLRALRAPARLRRPHRDVEIAQAAAAELHLGLEQVERAAEARVPLAPVRLQLLEEALEALSFEDLPAGGAGELLEDRLVP